MKILKLTIVNVKCIRVVEITPDGNVVIISGRNGQGKSSVLDSITYGLGGAGTIPAVPVRRGMKALSVKIDIGGDTEIGDFIVHRTCSASGGTNLSVTPKNGPAIRSAQAFLDGLGGSISFDPLNFTRLKPADQAERLRLIAGLDFTVQDKARQAAYDERTLIGRDLKAAEARLAAVPPVDAGVPDEEVSASAILVEQSVAVTKNNANARMRRAADDKAAAQVVASRELSTARAEVDRVTTELARITMVRNAAVLNVESLISNLTTANKIMDQARQATVGLIDIDLSPFEARCRQTERINEQVRAKKERRLLETAASGLRYDHQKSTQQIEEIDKSKTEAISASKMPFPGLSLSIDGNVEFNSLPFEQASDAEKIKVSVGIGLALNPKLRVLLIRDGSLLDASTLQTIGKMAEERDAQIWIEIVSTDDPGAIVLEDGSIIEVQSQVTAADPPSAHAGPVVPGANEAGLPADSTDY